MTQHNCVCVYVCFGSIRAALRSGDEVRLEGGGGGGGGPAYRGACRGEGQCTKV